MQLMSKSPLHGPKCVSVLCLFGSCKFTVKLLGGGEIGAVSGGRAVEVTKMTLAAVHMEMRLPLVVARIPANTLEAAGVVSALA
jgi:hypothetical protein